MGGLLHARAGMYMDWFAILLHQATVCLGTPGTFGTLGTLGALGTLGCPAQPPKLSEATQRKTNGPLGLPWAPLGTLGASWGPWAPRVLWRPPKAQRPLEGLCEAGFVSDPTESRSG